MSKLSRTYIHALVSLFCSIACVIANAGPQSHHAPGKIAVADVLLPHITIVSPAQDATVVAAPLITISGTATGSTDIGIVVADVPAAIDTSLPGTVEQPFQWVAQIPAWEGTNQSASAVITDGAGNTEEVSVDFTTVKPEEYVSISPSVMTGTEPLSISYRLSTVLATAPSGYEVDADGDGIYEIQETSLESFVHLYGTPGTYTVHVRVTTIDQRTFTGETTVTIQPFAVLDALLRQKWNGFVAALTDGDTAGATQYLSDAARARYADTLSELQLALRSFGSSVAAVRSQTIDARTAQYLIVRLQNGNRFGYHITFGRDRHDVWRLTRF